MRGFASQLQRCGRGLLLAFAIVSGTLYACFLPLWEGFDEPFHYAYVESLAAEHHFPVFGRSKVPAEIYVSLSDVPLSRLLSGIAPGAVSFEQWFALPTGEKQMRAARGISTALRKEPSNLDNYEAQQAPLAYLLLAPVDAALASSPLRNRVLVLRLIAACLAAVLLWFGLGRLCQMLLLSDVYVLATMACVFGSQMLWATVAHVGNDSLAVPLTLLFLTWLLLASGTRQTRHVLVLGAIFAAGLLTKAYFLSFVPVYLGLVAMNLRRTRNYATALAALALPLVLAGPWYWHNYRLYGSFSGTQQSVAGIGILQALAAIPKIPWWHSTVDFFRWSLWTGNWSFLSFSKLTLNIELIFVGTGLVLYFSRFRRIRAAEWWGLAACGCFICGLIYQTCVTYIHTNGASKFAEPWYWQGVVCFLWALAFRGLFQSSQLGRAIALGTVLVSAWIAALTYVAKLFPLYGGGFERATLRRVCGWWCAHPTQDLSLVALAPPAVLYCLLTLFLLILAAQTAWIVARLIGSELPTE